MNAIDLLKTDHKNVNELFSEFMAASEDDLEVKEDLFQQIKKELLTHTDIEEAIFYPSVKKVAPDVIGHSLAEHQEVKQLLSEMLEYEVDDEEFDKRINLLIEKVNAHVQEEESPDGALEIARRSFDEQQLEQIGRRMEQHRRSAGEELAA